MQRYLVRAFVIAALLAAVTAPVAGANRIGATLDGRAIPLGRVGGLACHDFEFPMIRCFGSVARLEADVAGRVVSGSSTTGLATVSVAYVVVFEHAQYAGPNPKVLTSDVPWLSDIGWNDKISSFKSYGAYGVFYEHSPSGGFIYSFGSTARVPYVGDYYNDKFSSFYID